MAWRSSGTTNAELVDNLVQNGLISNSDVEQGFRRVDRKHFVPKGCEDEAYSDSPIKRGGVHISAPHIYCTVLEALDLTPGSSLSFLNIGSGSGYLTCIASEILGPKSLYYGVDINKEALNHCQEAVAAWHTESSSTTHNNNTNSSNNNNDNNRTLPLMYFIHGNGLNIQPDAGESVVGFDRIYAGAAISSSQQKKIQQLLSPGGVMVAPVGSELRKITRMPMTTATATATVQSSNTSIDIDSDDFTTQIISGVHFASLVSLPRKNTIIPSAQWSTTNHHLYPASFQKATKTLLLCRNSNAIQPIVEERPRDKMNLSASLPKEVWLHILSFTTRKWFEPKLSEVELLRRENEMMRLRLSQEQSNLSQTRHALSRAESRNRLLQRQNQIHLSVARRFHHHLENMLLHGIDSSSTEEFSLSPEIVSSTQSLIEQTRNTLFNAELSRMDVSFEMMEEDESDSDDDDDDDEEMSFDSDTNLSVAESDSAMVADDNSSFIIQGQQSSAENARQVRTVSISSADL